MTLGQLRPISYRGLYRSLGTYLKFQVLTKLMTLAVVAPVLALATATLVELDGQAVVTQATLLPFLLSWRGAGFAAALALVFVAGFVIELNGFITICSRAMHGLPEANYRDVLLHGLKRARNLIGLALPVVLIYMAVIVPLTGAGATIAQLTQIRIPNFVMSVISESGGLLAAYGALLAVLAVIGATLSFTFHFVVLDNQPVTRAVANSVRLSLGHWQRYLRMVLEAGLGALVVSLISLSWLIGVFLLMVALGVDSAWERVLFMALWLIQQSVVGLFTFLLAPVQMHALTRTFYDCAADDTRFAHLVGTVPELPPKGKASLLDRAFGRRWGIVALWVVVVLALGVPGGLMAGALLRNPERIEVVGHRAGGFGTPENSLTGLTFAIAQGAWGVEVDVQRSADGVYVLNHDDTFRRAAGEPRRSSEMRVDEIRRLDIDPDPHVVEPVPTLEEFLLAARGHTKVFIELKGATADSRMADDIVGLIERLGMRADAIVISLNYQLIRHIEATHPVTQTGYLYFFAFGSVDKLDGDYLILEEGEASDSRLIAIADAGKRAIVWTVNEHSSMQRFAGKPVFALITDEIVTLDAVLRQRGSGTDLDLFAALFLGPFW